MRYNTLDEIEQDFSRSLGELVRLYNKAMKLVNRGYDFTIDPYRFLWGDGVLTPDGRIQIKEKKFFTKWRTLVSFEMHRGEYFSIAEKPYTFYDTEGTYKAVEEIAASFISQLKTFETTLKKPELSDKIENFAKEFDKIVEEIK